jgi:hypothetical protein
MKAWLLPLWLGSTAVTIYTLHLRYAAPVEAPAGVKSLATGAASPFARLGDIDLRTGTVLVNFWREGCPCSRFAEAEFAEIARQFPELRTVTVVDGTLEGWRARGLPGQSVANEGGIAKRFGVWAAPAAAVIANGRMVYVGAYNVSRYCANEETAFARKAISAALKGEAPQVRSTPFFGCALDAKP